MGVKGHNKISRNRKGTDHSNLSSLTILFNGFQDRVVKVEGGRNGEYSPESVGKVNIGNTTSSVKLEVSFCSEE